MSITRAAALAILAFGLTGCGTNINGGVMPGLANLPPADNMSGEAEPQTSAAGEVIESGQNDTPGSGLLLRPAPSIVW